VSLVIKNVNDWSNPSIKGTIARAIRAQIKICKVFFFLTIKKKRTKQGKTFFKKSDSKSRSGTMPLPMKKF